MRNVSYDFGLGYHSLQGFRVDESSIHTCTDPEGETGVRIPLKNHKNIGLPSNTGLDPLKNPKATKPEFNVRLSSG